MSVVIVMALVVAVAAGAVLLLVGARRRGPLLVDPTRGTPALTVSGTSFAVLLAFVTLVGLQTYSGAKAGARRRSPSSRCSARPRSSPPISVTSCVRISSATAEPS
jgi:hypothetical protein